MRAKKKEERKERERDERKSEREEGRTGEWTRRMKKEGLRD